MKSPFKFLDSYTKDDREIFFGRDREIEELYQKVFESKLLLVYGISGTGKSSLINCGLANKFQETDWLPLVVRRGGNMIDSMASAIRAASLTKQQSKFTNPSDFKKGVRSLYLDHYKPVFFIFDQFEELFIFGDREERKSFISIVRLLTEFYLQCRMVFVMREEYMAGITEFEKYIPTIFSNRVRIEKMSHINALDAIKGPCEKFNITLEEGFAEALLEKLSPGETDVELTYLQVFLDKIFRLAVGSLPPPGGESKGGSSPTPNPTPTLNFTLSLLEKTGNVSDLLGSFLDDQISLMEDSDTAMTVLKAFVSGKGTKRPASEQEATDNIRSFGKELSVETMKELIQTFVKLRVLRDKDDNGRYELRHDALAEKVYEKFSTTEKELLEIRQFIENSYQSYLKRKILLSNDDLTYISNKDSLLNLNPELQGFMDENRKYQKIRLKTFKWLLAISAFALVTLFISIGVLLNRKIQTSKSDLLVQESITQFTKPMDRLCLAYGAWNIYPGENAKEALLEAFNYAIRQPEEDTNLFNLKKEVLKELRPVSSSIEFADCSDDNRFMYGCTSDSVFIWNSDGTMFSEFTQGTSHIVLLLMSSDGEYIGAVSTDSLLRIWDNKGHLHMTAKTTYNNINTNQIFRFTTDNKVLAISDTSDAILYEINGDVVQNFNLHKGNVNAVDFSKDGRFIATASSDSKINIWYLNSSKNNYDLYNIITSHKDTVWSIDFASNNRFIVSASSDGRVLVNSINGDITSEFSNKISDVEDFFINNPVYAEFDKSGSGITITSSSSGENIGKPCMSAIYVDTDYYVAKTDETDKFDFISFSPDKKYLVFVSGDEKALISRVQFYPSIKHLYTNYKLISIEGKKPFFSPDGKYIYTINGNHLKSWFIDIEAICEMAEGFYNKWVDN